MGAGLQTLGSCGPKLAACTCSKATRLSLVTLSSNFRQPGAERTTQQGHPGQQVSGSEVEECGVGIRAQWQQPTKESGWIWRRVRSEQVRMQLSDGGARLGAGQECQNGLDTFSAYGCMWVKTVPLQLHYSGTWEGLPGVSGTPVPQRPMAEKVWMRERWGTERQVHRLKRLDVKQNIFNGLD